MSEKMIENNKVSVIGEVVSEFTFSHEVFGEGFYIADLAVSRLSDQVDVIPLMISERLLDVSKDYRGMTMEAIGQFRSYNRHEGAKNRLCCLCLSVRFISWKNLRITPKPTRFFWKAISARSQSTGKHRWDSEIADMLLAVNRPYGKSDYIPCIAWGRNARYASGFGVGSHVCVWGRVQSREYTKKLSETECEKRVAYEVSVSKLECVEE